MEDAVRRLNSEQVVALCDELASKTNTGDLRWRPGTPAEFWFTAYGPTYSYSITSVDRDDVHPFSLSVWVDAEHELATASSDQNLEPLALERLERIYRLAKARALSADDVFNDILNDLRGLEEPF